MPTRIQNRVRFQTVQVVLYRLTLNSSQYHVQLVDVQRRRDGDRSQPILHHFAFRYITSPNLACLPFSHSMNSRCPEFGCFSFVQYFHRYLNSRWRPLLHCLKTLSYIGPPQHWRFCKQTFKEFGQSGDEFGKSQDRVK